MGGVSTKLSWAAGALGGKGPAPGRLCLGRFRGVLPRGRGPATVTSAAPSRRWFALILSSSLAQTKELVQDGWDPDIFLEEKLREANRER